MGIGRLQNFNIEVGGADAVTQVDTGTETTDKEDGLKRYVSGFYEYGLRGIGTNRDSLSLCPYRGNLILHQFDASVHNWIENLLYVLSAQTNPVSYRPYIVKIASWA